MILRTEPFGIVYVVSTGALLNPSILESAIAPEGLSIHSKDPTIGSGKSKGEAVCFMINNQWHSDVEIISPTLISESVSSLKQMFGS